MPPTRTRGSLYLDSSSSVRLGKTGPRKALFVAILLLTLGVFSTTLSYISITPPAAHIAHATDCDDDENCDKKTIDEAFDESDYGANDEGFDQLMEDLQSNKDGKADDEQNILYAFKRHFTLGYMNEGDKAVVGSKDGEDNPLAWYKTTFKNRNEYNCGRGYEFSSGGTRYYPGEKDKTIYWHNCDVPNLMTEFVQDVAVLFFEPGFSNGAVDSSYTKNTWFGFSSNTPDNARQTGAQNLTAMEVFGYNLNYTSYRGEWDHIKVMTAARALSNFGFLDKLKLGAQAILNGILGGVNAAVNGLVADFKSGNLVRIITSPMRFVGNLFGGGTSATLDTVIDTSDTNVFATMSWYRPEFGATLYNARALSQDEIVDYIQGQLALYIQEIAKDREKAEVPADLAAIGPDKLAATSLPSTGGCTATGTYTVGAAAPVPANWTFAVSSANAELCDAAVTQRKTEISAAEAPATVTFDLITSFGPSKTVAQWVSETGVEAAVDKYGILCSIAGSDSTDPAGVVEFIECMRNEQVGWPAAVARETLNEQTKLDTAWFESSFDQKAISTFFRKQATSFTSPTAKYICLNPDGTDMKRNGQLVRLVVGTKNDQSYNDACAPVRSPIQNGLFGNGYVGAQPPVDTRREVFTPSLWDISDADEMMAGAGLTVAKFTTQISNTMLNLSFTPILSTIGADTIITNLIIGFRDSLFFPLAVLLIIIGALSIFFQAGTKRNYGAQGKSLLLMVGVFFLGTLLMSDPYRTVRFVDEAPATVEAAIVGSIFDLGSGEPDPLCNASSEPSIVGTKDDLDNTISFDPAASSRNILCENWKTFVFNTYVYGQWGTHYSNMDYAEFQASGDQGVLVGNGENRAAPYVPLGGSGNNSVSNWAAYQLDVLTAGTVTGQDPAASKVVDPDMYRLVDLQAGPGGKLANAPYDASHYEMWRGDNPTSRIMVSWLGALTSIMGMITMTVFAFAKIQVSLMATLLLLFMPFMFLIGLLPNQGRFKLKGYFMQIISLMVQRVVLISMLALMLRIITTFASSTENFFYYTILTIATCAAFLVYRKEILKLFGNVFTKGGGFGQNLNVGEYVPKTVRQKSAIIVNGTRSAAYAGVGGFMAGGVEGARSGVRGGWARSGSMLHKKQAREGFGALRVAANARDAAITQVKQGDPGTGRRPGTEGLDQFFDRSMTPAAEARAAKTLEEEGVAPEERDRRLAEETQKELARMRPDGTKKERKQYRDLGRLRRSSENLYETDSRTDAEIRDELRSTVRRSHAEDASEIIADRVEELKPKVVESERAREKYTEAIDRVAENAETTYVRAGDKEASEEYRDEHRKDRIVSVFMGGTRTDEDGTVTSYVEREEERFENEEAARAYFRDSAKEIMEEFRDQSKDKLSPKDEA